MKKYLVIGDFIRSKYDYEWHFINARKLCDLYRVDPKECILVNREEDLRGIRAENFIILRPQYNYEDYKLPG